MFNLKQFFAKLTSRHLKFQLEVRLTSEVASTMLQSVCSTIWAHATHEDENMQINRRYRGYTFTLPKSVNCIIVIKWTYKKISAFDAHSDKHLVRYRHSQSKIEVDILMVWCLFVSGLLRRKSYFMMIVQNLGNIHSYIKAKYAIGCYAWESTPFGSTKMCFWSLKLSVIKGNCFWLCYGLLCFTENQCEFHRLWSILAVYMEVTCY